MATQKLFVLVTHIGYVNQYTTYRITGENQDKILELELLCNIIFAQCLVFKLSVGFGKQ